MAPVKKRSKLLIILRSGVQVPMEVEEYNIKLSRDGTVSLAVTQTRVPTRLEYIDQGEIVLILSEVLPDAPV